MQYHGDKNHEFCEHPRNAAIKGKAHATLSAKEYCDNRRYLWTYYSTNVNQFKCGGHEDPDKRVIYASYTNRNGPAWKTRNWSCHTTFAAELNSAQYREQSGAKSRALCK